MILNKNGINYYKKIIIEIQTILKEIDTNKIPIKDGTEFTIPEELYNKVIELNKHINNCLETLSKEENLLKVFLRKLLAYETIHTSSKNKKFKFSEREIQLVFFNIKQTLEEITSQLSPRYNKADTNKRNKLIRINEIESLKYDFKNLLSLINTLNQISIKMGKIILKDIGSFKEIVNSISEKNKDEKIYFTNILSWINN